MDNYARFSVFSFTEYRQRRKRPGNPVLRTRPSTLNFAEKIEIMAKRYTESEKRSLLASFSASGQKLAAFSRSAGVSVPTLKAWQAHYGLSSVSAAWAAPAFVPIEASSPGLESSLQVRVRGIELEFSVLPPATWLGSFVKMLGE